MNWPHTFRVIAEVYSYTAAQISALTFDQLWVLCQEPKALKSTRFRKMSFEEAQALGVIPNFADMQRLAAKRARREKKQRRAERLKRMEAYRNGVQTSHSIR